MLTSALNRETCVKNKIQSNTGQLGLKRALSRDNSVNNKMLSNILLLRIIIHLFTEWPFKLSVMIQYKLIPVEQELLCVLTVMHSYGLQKKVVLPCAAAVERI
jgi:hypothetical protein